MPTEADRRVFSSKDARQPPSDPLLSLISEIARAHELDVRFWAGVTLTKKLSSRESDPGAKSCALASIQDALVGGYATDPNFELMRDDKGEVADVQWGSAFGDNHYAALVLAMMKVDDIDVRRVALEALVISAGPDKAADFAVTKGAIRRFLGWVSQENRTRH
ncbi:hypothetical protein MMB232_00718 [Brevundimonas subvibrioides]|uniref:hypothetical protein n=1 Tax=Brevundimonas subvibrioides TaxID=74313 RepID=UPI0032D5B0C7